MQIFACRPLFSVSRWCLFGCSPQELARDGALWPQFRTAQHSALRRIYSHAQSRAKHMFKCPAGPGPTCVAPCRTNLKMVEWAEQHWLMFLLPVPGNKRSAAALSPLLLLWLLFFFLLFSFSFPSSFPPLVTLQTDLVKVLVGPKPSSCRLVQRSCWLPWCRVW